MRAVSAIFVSLGGSGRDRVTGKDVLFDRLTGISSCCQYFMLREGEVLMRSYTCWFSACFKVAAAGPGAGT